MIVALIALVVALSGVAVAAIPGPDGVIKGCYANGGLLSNKGALRVVDHDASCRSGETQITWNQPGVKGDPGPPGPSTGPAGGDLTGSYPNPAIASGAITGDKVKPRSLSLGHLVGAGDIRGVDAPTIPAHSCTTLHVDGIDGTYASSYALMQENTGLDDRLFYITSGTDHGSNDIRVRVCNVSNAAVDPEPESFIFRVFD